nr:uncharacterized protein LOC127303829 [Lolium perenne]
MAKPGGRRSAEAPAQARRGLRPSHSTRRTGGDEIVTAHHGRVADAFGANDGGGETRIDADQRARRRAAVRLRPISPAGAAGDGRNNSASTAATQGSPELGEEGDDEEEEDDEDDKEDGDEEDEKEEDAMEDAEYLVEVDVAGVRKNKKAASGSRGPKWKVLKDQCLCKSWSTVSYDSIIGTNHK